jgi:hypothetical protein
MEDFLYDWSKQEYLQILKYTANSSFKTVLSNYRIITAFRGEKEDEEDNLNNQHHLSQENQKSTNPILFSDQMV